MDGVQPSQFIGNLLGCAMNGAPIALLRRNASAIAQWVNSPPSQRHMSRPVSLEASLRIASGKTPGAFIAITLKPYLTFSKSGPGNVMESCSVRNNFACTYQNSGLGITPLKVLLLPAAWKPLRQMQQARQLQKCQLLHSYLNCSHSVAFSIVSV